MNRDREIDEIGYIFWVSIPGEAFPSGMLKSAGFSDPLEVRATRGSRCGELGEAYGEKGKVEVDGSFSVNDAGNSEN